jgi:hypothetical protein
MSLHTDIRAALEEHLVATPGLPEARAWEGVKFDPPAVTIPYLRAVYAPASSRPVSLGTQPWFQHLGVLLVDLWYPVGSGARQAELMADAVRSRYGLTTNLSKNGTQVRIRYAERGRGLSVDGRYLVPVTVAWRCLSQQS